MIRPKQYPMLVGGIAIAITVRAHALVDQSVARKKVSSISFIVPEDITQILSRDALIIERSVAEEDFLHSSVLSNAYTLDDPALASSLAKSTSVQSMVPSLSKRTSARNNATHTSICKDYGERFFVYGDVHGEKLCAWAERLATAKRCAMAAQEDKIVAEWCPVACSACASVSSTSPPTTRPTYSHTISNVSSSKIPSKHSSSTHSPTAVTNNNSPSASSKIPSHHSSSTYSPTAVKSNNSPSVLSVSSSKIPSKHTSSTYSPTAVTSSNAPSVLPSNAPVSSDSSTSMCKDYGGRFFVYGDIYGEKLCTWAKRLTTVKRCAMAAQDDKIVAEWCPVSCSACSPTISPTAFPSVSTPKKESDEANIASLQTNDNKKGGAKGDSLTIILSSLTGCLALLLFVFGAVFLTNRNRRQNLSRSIDTDTGLNPDPSIAAADLPASEETRVDVLPTSNRKSLGLHFPFANNEAVARAGKVAEYGNMSASGDILEAASVSNSSHDEGTEASGKSAFAQRIKSDYTDDDENEYLDFLNSCPDFVLPSVANQSERAFFPSQIQDNSDFFGDEKLIPVTQIIFSNEE